MVLATPMKMGQWGGEGRGGGAERGRRGEKPSHMCNFSHIGSGR